MSTQKQLADMLRVYQQALQLMQTHRIEEGTSLIRGLLSSALINDPDLRHLKYSALLSLAEVSQHTGQFLPALKYYYAAMECNADGSFMLLLKMYKLSELLQLTDISIVLLKKALKISPCLWKERVLDMLANAYQGAGRNEALRDLQHVRGNKLRMEEILMEDWCVPARTTFAPPQPQEPRLRHLKISIDLAAIGGKYGTREYLLTIAYILLKCKLPRNFHARKFYNKDSPVWGQFIRQYHPIFTSVSFVFEGERQNCHEASNLINQLAVSLLREIHRGGKKKETKVQATAKKPSKLNSISLWAYYREGLNKASFKREWLSCLQQWDSELYQSIFGKIFAAEDQPENTETRMNEKQAEKTPRKVQKLARQVEDTLTNHQGNIHRFVESVYVRGDRIGQKMLMKCVTKMIESTEGCMAEVNARQLLADLVDRLEYLLDKKYTDHDSHLYKNSKIREISTFIDQKYPITLSSLRDCLNTPEAEPMHHIAKLLLRKSCLMVALDTSKANSDIEFYSRVCQALNPAEDLEAEVDKLARKMLKLKSELELAKQNEFKMLSERQVETKQAPAPSSSIYDVLSEYSSKKRVVCKEECKTYLQSLVELLMVFSNALEGKDEQKSNLRQLSKVYDRIQIKRFLAELLQKIETEQFRVSQVSLKLKNTVLYHLIRLHLLGLQRLLRHSEQCLRLVFYLTYLVSRDMNPDQKDSLIARVVGLYAWMLSDLMRNKEDKEEVRALYLVKKKFFNNVFTRNLEYIRHSSLFGVTNDNKRSMQENLAVCLESYFYDKETPFSAKKYSEALGYLFFLSHWHYDGFNCETIEMKPQVSRILREVVPIYEKNRKEYCGRVKQLVAEFTQMMKDGESIGLQRVVAGEEEVCRCCEDYRKVPLIIAKYYELIQDERKNEYFLEFFLLNVHSERGEEAWEHLLRTHCQQFCARLDNTTAPHNQEQGQRRLKLGLLDLALSNPATPTYVRKEAYYWQFLFSLLRLKFRQSNDMLQNMQDPTHTMVAYRDSLQELLSVDMRDDVRVGYLKLMEVIIPFAKLDGFKTVTVREIAGEAGQLLRAMSSFSKFDVVGNLDLNVIISIYIILAEELEGVLDALMNEKKSEEQLRNALDVVHRFAGSVPEKYQMKQSSQEELFSQLEKYDEARKETVVSGQDEGGEQIKDIIEAVQIEEIDYLQRIEDEDGAMEEERQEEKGSQIPEKQSAEVRNRQGPKNAESKKKRQSKSKARVLSYFRSNKGVASAEVMVIEMENIINRLMVIFAEQTKKPKIRRFSAQANLACARWCLKYGGFPTRVQDILSSKNAFLLRDECKKKNDILANFYERSVVRYISQANSILELIRVYIEHNCFFRIATLLISQFKSSEPTKEIRVLLVYGVCRLLQAVVNSKQRMDQKLDKKVTDLCNKIRKVGESHDKNAQEKRVEQLVGQYEDRWGCQLKVKWLKIGKAKDRRKSGPQRQDGLEREEEGLLEQSRE